MEKCNFFNCPSASILERVDNLAFFITVSAVYNIVVIKYKNKKLISKQRLPVEEHLRIHISSNTWVVDIQYLLPASTDALCCQFAVRVSRRYTLFFLLLTATEPVFKVEKLWEFIFETAKVSSPYMYILHDFTVTDSTRCHKAYHSQYTKHR